MKLSWGAGVAVAVLLSIVLYLVGLVNLAGMVSSMLLLGGLWTVVAALTIVERKDRMFYAGWGIVVAVLSLFSVSPSINYTIALVLIAIVSLILVSIYNGRAQGMVTAGAKPPSPAGETPAATRPFQSRP